MMNPHVPKMTVVLLAAAVALHWDLPVVSADGRRAQGFDSPESFAPPPTPLVPSPLEPAPGPRSFFPAPSGAPTTVAPATLPGTYQRPSRPIPHDKHPRTGLLDLSLPPDAGPLPPGHRLRITVQDVPRNFAPLEGFAREPGLWRFESEPLVPGIPHVYTVTLELVRVEHQVETRWGMQYENELETPVETLGVRRVRLIPGRIVSLGF